MSALLAEMEPVFRGRAFVYTRENWRSLAENERLLGRLRNASVVLLILLLSMSSARFAWSLFTPPPEIAPPLTAAAPAIGQPALDKDTVIAEIAALGEKLAALHLFGETDPGASTVAATAAMSEAPATTLALVLKGLLFTASSSRGMAVIAEREKPGPAGLYGVGETVPGNAVIEAVFVDRVVLRRAGRLESLVLESKEESRLEEAPGPAAPAGKTKQLSRQFVEQTLANLPDLSKGVQTQIHTPKDGRPGFRLMAPERSDFLNNVGLQPGDVLYEVNGIPLTDYDGARAAFQQLRDAGEVRLVFERKGVERSLTFAIH